MRNSSFNAMGAGYQIPNQNAGGMMPSPMSYYGSPMQMSPMGQMNPALQQQQVMGLAPNTSGGGASDSFIGVLVVSNDPSVVAAVQLASAQLPMNVVVQTASGADMYVKAAALKQVRLPLHALLVQEMVAQMHPNEIMRVRTEAKLPAGPGFNAPILKEELQLARPRLQCAHLEGGAAAGAYEGQAAGPGFNAPILKEELQLAGPGFNAPILKEELQLAGPGFNAPILKEELQLAGPGFNAPILKEDLQLAGPGFNAPILKEDLQLAGPGFNAPILKEELQLAGPGFNAPILKEDLQLVLMRAKQLQQTSTASTSSGGASSQPGSPLRSASMTPAQAEQAAAAATGMPCYVFYDTSTSSASSFGSCMPSTPSQATANILAELQMLKLRAESKRMSTSLNLSTSSAPHQALLVSAAAALAAPHLSLEDIAASAAAALQAAPTGVDSAAGVAGEPVGSGGGAVDGPKPQPLTLATIALLDSGDGLSSRTPSCVSISNSPHRFRPGRKSLELKEPLAGSSLRPISGHRPPTFHSSYSNLAIEDKPPAAAPLPLVPDPTPPLPLASDTTPPLPLAPDPPTSPPHTQATPPPVALDPALHLAAVEEEAYMASLELERLVSFQEDGDTEELAAALSRLEAAVIRREQLGALVPPSLPTAAAAAAAPAPTGGALAPTPLPIIPGGAGAGGAPAAMGALAPPSLAPGGPYPGPIAYLREAAAALASVTGFSPTVVVTPGLSTDVPGAAVGAAAPAATNSSIAPTPAEDDDGDSAATPRSPPAPAGLGEGEVLAYSPTASAARVAAAAATAGAGGAALQDDLDEVELAARELDVLLNSPGEGDVSAAVLRLELAISKSEAALAPFISSPPAPLNTLPTAAPLLVPKAAPVPLPEGYSDSTPYPAPTHTSIPPPPGATWWSPGGGRRVVEAEVQSAARDLELQMSKGDESDMSAALSRLEQAVSEASEVAVAATMFEADIAQAAFELEDAVKEDGDIAQAAFELEDAVKEDGDLNLNSNVKTTMVKADIAQAAFELEDAVKEDGGDIGSALRRLEQAVSRKDNFENSLEDEVRSATAKLERVYESAEQSDREEEEVALQALRRAVSRKNEGSRRVLASPLPALGGVKEEEGLGGVAVGLATSEALGQFSGQEAALVAAQQAEVRVKVEGAAEHLGFVLGADNTDQGAVEEAMAEDTDQVAVQLAEAKVKVEEAAEHLEFVLGANNTDQGAVEEAMAALELAVAVQAQFEEANRKLSADSDLAVAASLPPTAGQPGRPLDRYGQHVPDVVSHYETIAATAVPTPLQSAQSIPRYETAAPLSPSQSLSRYSPVSTPTAPLSPAQSMPRSVAAAPLSPSQSMTRYSPVSSPAAPLSPTQSMSRYSPVGTPTAPLSPAQSMPRSFAAAPLSPSQSMSRYSSVGTPTAPLSDRTALEAVAVAEAQVKEAMWQLDAVVNNRESSPIEFAAALAQLQSAMANRDETFRAALALGHASLAGSANGGYGAVVAADLEVSLIPFLIMLVLVLVLAWLDLLMVAMEQLLLQIWSLAGSANNGYGAVVDADLESMRSGPLSVEANALLARAQSMKSNQTLSPRQSFNELLAAAHSTTSRPIGSGVPGASEAGSVPASANTSRPLSQRPSANGDLPPGSSMPASASTSRTTSQRPSTSGDTTSLAAALPPFHLPPNRRESLKDQAMVLIARNNSSQHTPLSSQASQSRLDAYSAAEVHSPGQTHAPPSSQVSQSRLDAYAMAEVHSPGQTRSPPSTQVSQSRLDASSVAEVPSPGQTRAPPSSQESQSRLDASSVVEVWPGLGQSLAGSYRSPPSASSSRSNLAPRASNSSAHWAAGPSSAHHSPPNASISTTQLAAGPLSARHSPPKASYSTNHLAAGALSAHHSPPKASFSTNHLAAGAMSAHHSPPRASMSTNHLAPSAFYPTSNQTSPPSLPPTPDQEPTSNPSPSTSTRHLSPRSSANPPPSALSSRSPSRPPSHVPSTSDLAAPPSYPSSHSPPSINLSPPTSTTRLSPTTSPRHSTPFGMSLFNPALPAPQTVDLSPRASRPPSNRASAQDLSETTGPLIPEPSRGTSTHRVSSTGEYVTDYDWDEMVSVPEASNELVEEHIRQVCTLYDSLALEASTSNHTLADMEGMEASPSPVEDKGPHDHRYPQDHNHGGPHDHDHRYPQDHDHGGPRHHNLRGSISLCGHIQGNANTTASGSEVSDGRSMSPCRLGLGSHPIRVVPDDFNYVQGNAAAAAAVAASGCVSLTLLPAAVRLAMGVPCPTS
eukprot:gene6788-30753_t